MILMSKATQRYSAGYNTCMGILSALSSVAASTPFDKISINQVCQEAGISRATFYYHFKDKFDVVQWHFDLVTSEYLREIGRSFNWKDGYRLNTNEFLKYKNLYQAAFRDRGYQSLFKYAKRDRSDSLHATLVDYLHIQIDEELEFQIQALADVEVGAVSRWFKDGMTIDVDTFCGYLEKLVPQRLHDLLDAPLG